MFRYYISLVDAFRNAKDRHTPPPPVSVGGGLYLGAGGGGATLPPPILLLTLRGIFSFLIFYQKFPAEHSDGSGQVDIT